MNLNMKIKVSNIVLLNYNFLKCMRFYLHVCLRTMFASIALKGQKKASDPFGLEFQTIVSCRMGTGDRTQVLWESS